MTAGAVLPYPDPPLGDDAVALRPWREGDVSGGMLAFADPLTQRFSWAEARSWGPADARAYFEGQAAGRERDTQLELALVEPADDGVVLGCAALYDVDLGQRQASVGYWLAAPARGRGIATRGVRLLARWAFDELRLERLQLTCAPENVASQRVAERCGFTREALLRSYFPFKGGLRDTVVFGRLANDGIESAPRPSQQP